MVSPPAVRSPRITSHPPYQRIRPRPEVKKKVIQALLVPCSRSDWKYSSRSSWAFLANFRFSYSSEAKAFTTWMPTRFSWRMVTASPMRNWTCIHIRRSLPMTREERMTMKGTKARLMRVSSQFMKMSIAKRAITRTTTSRARTKPMLTNRRTASTSAVALDIRSPVCSLSW